MRPIHRQTPVLFVGDSPTLPTGLARIGRDLATRLAEVPDFRVGYFGRGGNPSRSLPFAQYPFMPVPNVTDWGEPYFTQAWRDFVGSGARDHGVLFSVWDPSRVGWLALPNYGADPSLTDLAKLLRSEYVEKWGYFAIDAWGTRPDYALTEYLAETVAGYDRVLAYTEFGHKVLQSSIATSAQDRVREIDWLPHGIETATFAPRLQSAARMAWHVPGTPTAANTNRRRIVIGCVMTNQPRKDFGLLFSMIRALRVNHPQYDVVWLLHTNDLTMHWDIRALMSDFECESGEVRVTYHEATDEAMSYFYSACDFTVLPTLGEGFGYPIVESLACGVPVLTGNYAAASELVLDRDWLIDPVAFRLDTRYNMIRPVYDSAAWTERVARACQWVTEMNGIERRRVEEQCRATVEHLGWDKLWPVWERWFRRGTEGAVADMDGGMDGGMGADLTGE